MRQYQAIAWIGHINTDLSPSPGSGRKLTAVWRLVFKILEYYLLSGLFLKGHNPTEILHSQEGAETMKEPRRWFSPCSFLLEAMALKSVLFPPPRLQMMENQGFSWWQGHCGGLPALVIVQFLLAVTAKKETAAGPTAELAPPQLTFPHTPCPPQQLFHELIWAPLHSLCCEDQRQSGQNKKLSYHETSLNILGMEMWQSDLEMKSYWTCWLNL